MHLLHRWQLITVPCLNSLRAIHSFTIVRHIKIFTPKMVLSELFISFAVVCVSRKYQFAFPNILFAIICNTLVRFFLMHRESENSQYDPQIHSTVKTTLLDYYILSCASKNACCQRAAQLKLKIRQQFLTVF